MAIQVSGNKLPVTPGEVLNILQYSTDSFGTFFSLDRVLYHEARYNLDAAARYPEFRAMAGDPYLRCTKRNSVIEAFIHRFGVPQYKFCERDKGPALNKDILERLGADSALSQDAQRFLGLYRELAEAEYMSSYLGQYRNLPMSVCEDQDNHRMVVAHPEWSILSTARFSASRPSTQNIKRDICDIYTAPKGWQMVFSDSGQIEPRITYSAFIRDSLIAALIRLYDDAYFGLLHYIQMSPPEEHAARADLHNIAAHTITDEMRKKRQRLKVLSLAGAYGSSNLASMDAELGPLYESRIGAHPERRAWVSRISADVRAGAEAFYGYFGTAVYPNAAGKYDKGSNGWVNHMARCGLNNPIQATAAELMCLSVVQANSILGKDDHIGSYKHDEGMFYVRDDRVDDLAPKLQECLAYDVEGWLPIRSDLHVGRKESPHVAGLF